MIDKLKTIKARYEELNALLSDPNVLKDHNLLKKYSKERSGLEEIATVYDEYVQVQGDMAAAKEMIEGSDDKEVQEFAKAELDELEGRLKTLEEKLRVLLVPKDPNDEKNTIVEIRAGTGGEEAALFAGDLFRMYDRFAEHQGWKVDVMNSNPTGSGGFKEIIFMVIGDHVYSRMKYESGVHRVQRVPVTESQGRIHTSAATVAVLPEADEVDIDINPNELEIDVFRSSGPGGQSVNTTDSAVRITHKPTGLVVTCQDEKSQHKNKAKALKVLRARLLEQAQAEQAAEMAEQRKAQVSTGDRSAKIRTYNFPQSRVTDHRIGFTTHGIDQVMDGQLNEMIDALTTHFQTEEMTGTPA